MFMYIEISYNEIDGKKSVKVKGWDTSGQLSKERVKWAGKGM